MEYGRIAILLLLTLLGGMLSGFWLASLCIALIAYIVWILYKLHQLYSWLEKGAKTGFIPDSDGIWERINHQILGIQKKSKKRRKRMVKLLKRSRGIITSLPYATVVLNGRNEIDWANENSGQLLGIYNKKDQGQCVDNLLRIPALNKLLSENKNVEIEIDAPLAGNRKLAVQLIPVGQTFKLLIARDISERIHIQQMRKHFIANASHELSTPLTVIRGYLEIISGDDNLSEHLQIAANTAYEQSARMQSIIEDLLQLSRLEITELNEHNQIVINMPSLLSSICKEEGALTSGQTHKVETDIDQHLKLKGSETEIVSLCNNLIHNAFRHTPPGTLIQVSWQKSSNNEACLIVKDNGPGIPDKHLPHLTERFYQVDQGRSDANSGTGLGLAIVQHILQRHEGELDIQSAYGKGSTFTACFRAHRVVTSN